MNSTVNISEQESKATSVFTAVEILLGATLLLTCVVFCQKSHLPTPTNVSIVILAIIDILNVKKILAVINATYAVAKRKPEKYQACRDSNPDLCDTGAAL